MISKDLTSYVKIYSKWIDDENCKQSIEELKNKEWVTHSFYNPKSDTEENINGSKEPQVTYESLTTNEYIMKRVWDSYYKYIVEDLKCSWFDGWNSYSQVRYNKYSKGCIMGLHCDHIYTLFDGSKRGIPILTALGCLNDDYEGGNFVMWDNPIKLSRGDIMIFPSIFLYPHKVEEITKGERYTFVSWAW